MTFALWSTIVGLLLVLMALGYTLLARLPLSTSMLYLLVGAALSPLWLDMSALDAISHTLLLERIAEVVVLLSLFTSGLKMSLKREDGRWKLPVRLASVSMLVTVGLVTAVGVGWLGLPLGAAVLLGAILAPTDPVLAAEVQVNEPGDRDRLRLALTGEAGLNDGSAFPMVMLGLGLLGLHELGSFGWRWVAVDLVWATVAGLAIGGVLGTLVGRLVLHLRHTHKEAIGLDNFLSLGLIGLAYGLAILAHGYGFLAVFAAGLALRRLEEQPVEDAAGDTAAGDATGRSRDGNTADLRDEEGGDSAAGASMAEVERAHSDPNPSRAEDIATHPQHASAYMTHAVLHFNEQIERIGEVAAVVAVGMLLWAVEWKYASWAFVALMLLVIRPLAVAVGIAGSDSTRTQRSLIGWFGIRGIGSLYYLTYAMNHGLDRALASQLVALTLSVVVVSIFLHGVSVTPLMNFYERRKKARRARPAAAPDA